MGRWILVLWLHQQLKREFKMKLESDIQLQLQMNPNLSRVAYEYLIPAGPVNIWYPD